MAEKDRSSCIICYKPTTAVLITEQRADFFYTCESHLGDRSFVTPIVDHEAEAAKEKIDDEKALKEEIERVKKEYWVKEQKRKADAKGDTKDEPKVSNEGNGSIES